jgi:hypothetical protein
LALGGELLEGEQHPGDTLGAAALTAADSQRHSLRIHGRERYSCPGR